MSARIVAAGHRAIGHARGVPPARPAPRSGDFGLAGRNVRSSRGSGWDKAPSFGAMIAIPQSGAGTDHVSLQLSKAIILSSINESTQMRLFWSE